MAITQEARRSEPRSTLGVVLVAFGLVALAAQVFRAELAAIAWPFWVIAPGLAMLALGLVGKSWRPFLYFGAITAVTGVILAYQWRTDHWTSWAYAWALTFPAAIGLAQIVEGAFDARRELVAEGISGVTAGLALFAVGLAFFEGVLHLGGVDLGKAGVDAFAFVLIACGVLMLAARAARAFIPREAAR